MRGRGLAISGAIAVVALTSGCGEPERSAGQPCLSLTAPVTERSVAASVEASAIDFYVDVSLSMPAFGRPDQAAGYTTVPYRNVLAALLAEQGRARTRVCSGSPRRSDRLM